MMLLSRFRRPSFALFGGLALFTACYRYTPAPADVSPGTRVEARLSDLGTVEMARYVGPGVGVIEGRLLDAADSVVTLGVVRTERRDGTENLWAGEPVPVPRALVSQLTVRRVDRARTTTAIGIAAAAIIAAGLAFAVKGNGSGSGGGGGGPR